MLVEVDHKNNEVILTSDQGSAIILSWSGALVLGGLLKEASVQAEPPALAGKSYRPATERSR